MNRFEPFFMMRYMMIVVTFLFVFCGPDRTPHITGTTVETENVITAKVYRKNGTPASGAKVVLREDGYIPSQLNPEKEYDVREAECSSSGDFTIAVDNSLTYFMEVKDEDELYWKKSVSLNSKSEGLNLGKIDLAKSSQVSATLKVELEFSEFVSYYVTVTGTDLLLKINENQTIEMNGLFPGEMDFTIIQFNSQFNRIESKIKSQSFQVKEGVFNSIGDLITDTLNGSSSISSSNPVQSSSIINSSSTLSMSCSTMDSLSNTSSSSSTFFSSAMSSSDFFSSSDSLSSDFFSSSDSLSSNFGSSSDTISSSIFSSSTLDSLGMSSSSSSQM